MDEPDGAPCSGDRVEQSHQLHRRDVTVGERALERSVLQQCLADLPRDDDEVGVLEFRVVAHARAAGVVCHPLPPGCAADSVGEPRVAMVWRDTHPHERERTAGGRSSSCYSGSSRPGVSITILTAVLPTIAREFDVGNHTVAWVVTGPMLVFGVLMPSMGKAGDLFGRKRVYLVGWAVSIAFSGLCCAVVERRDADRVPPPERSGRRGDRAGVDGAHPVGVPAGRAGEGDGVVVVRGGRRAGDRARRRWAARRSRRLALDLRRATAARDTRHRARGAGCFVRTTEGASALRRRGLRAARAGDGIAPLRAEPDGGSGWTSPRCVRSRLLLAPVLGVAFVACRAAATGAAASHLEYFKRRNVAVPMVLADARAHPVHGDVLPLAVPAARRARGTTTRGRRSRSCRVRCRTRSRRRRRATSRSSSASGSTAVGGWRRWLPGCSSWPASVPASSFGADRARARPHGHRDGPLASRASCRASRTPSRRRTSAPISAAQEMLMMVGMMLGMQGMQTIQAVRARVVGEAGGYHDAFLVGAVLAVVATVLAFAVRSMHRPQPVPPTESPEAPYLPEREINALGPAALIAFGAWRCRRSLRRRRSHGSRSPSSACSSCCTACTWSARSSSSWWSLSSWRSGSTRSSGCSSAAKIATRCRRRPRVPRSRCSSSAGSSRP